MRFSWQAWPISIPVLGGGKNRLTTRYGRLTSSQSMARCAAFSRYFLAQAHCLSTKEPQRSVERLRRCVADSPGFSCWACVTISSSGGATYCACMPLLVSSCRSEEHTSELQSLMRISYAVFCLKKKKQQTEN